jgi:hypothetical protein
MNIFVLDECPKMAAIQQVDKHVVKMTLETAQMLSTALRLNGSECPDLYRATHKNHPCTKWAKATRSNFLWLCEHGRSLAEEYTARYGKTHKSLRVIELAEALADTIPEGERTPFALAMPDQYKTESAVQSYRDFYNAEKASFAQWKRNKPFWWRDI